MSKYTYKQHIIAKDGTNGVVVKITTNHRGVVYCIIKNGWVNGRACIAESDVVGLYGDNRVISDNTDSIP